MIEEVAKLVDEGRGGDEKSRQGQKKWQQAATRSTEVAKLVDEGKIGAGEIREGAVEIVGARRGQDRSNKGATRSKKSLGRGLAARSDVDREDPTMRNRGIERREIEDLMWL